MVKGNSNPLMQQLWIFIIIGLLIGFVLGFIVGSVLTGNATGEAIVPGNYAKTQCSDSIDNDKDGAIDTKDTDCMDVKDDSEGKECSDGIDNDGDGYFDYMSPIARPSSTKPAETLLRVKGDSGCENLRDGDESNCGDNKCEGIENCITCPADCGCTAGQVCRLGKTDNGLCKYPRCGDGYEDRGEGELCDDGVNNVEARSCNVYGGTCCSTECVSVSGPRCGDGIVNGAEQCDGTLGVPEHYVCTSGCIEQYVPYCGDGIKNGAEECDGNDGVGEHQDCSNSCELINLPYCGDGILNGNEECDGTVDVPEHYVCTSECTEQYVPYCGDLICNGAESGATIATCSADCMNWVKSYGDYNLVLVDSQDHTLDARNPERLLYASNSQETSLGQGECGTDGSDTTAHANYPDNCRWIKLEMDKDFYNCAGDDLYVYDWAPRTAENYAVYVRASDTMDEESNWELIGSMTDKKTNSVDFNSNGLVIIKFDLLNSVDHITSAGPFRYVMIRVWHDATGGSDAVANYGPDLDAVQAVYLNPCS